MIPAETAVENRAFDFLEPLMDTSGIDRLRNLTRVGHLHSAQVNVAGVPSAVFFWRVESERLIVDTLTTVSDAPGVMQHALLAMEQVARANGCIELEASTPRRSMANCLIRNNWLPAKVLMRKTLVA